jgi:hypothetical protein
VSLGTVIKGALFWRRHKIGKKLKKVLQRRERDAAGGEFFPEDKESSVLEKLLRFIEQYRTSTKAGAAGLVPIAVAGAAMLPYYDQINALVIEACKSEQGPLTFLIGGVVVWVTMFVSARISKTPPNPGKL